MPNATTTRPACPQDVLQLLPWFLEASLEDAERGRVEAHVASCAACRNEIAMMEGEDAPLPDDLELPRPAEVYASVLARIGEATAPEAVSPLPRQRSRVVRTLLVAGLAALALVLGAVVGRSWLQPTGATEQVRYQPAAASVLEASSAPSAADELDVVFRADARLDSVTRSLRAIGGTVVSGPSPLGVYRVRLRDEGDGVAAAAWLKADDSGVASFAEPVLR